MNEIEPIRKKLILWYKRHGRDFPWRHTDDPYKIMIAEFMLHRTKAEQIIPVYNNFIEKYPDVWALACAQVSEMKKFTQSLGLHWRYKHFIDSTIYILDNYHGVYPQDYKELRKIPGIGEYISCAISIIAFKKPAPAVDANIARFFNRIHGFNLSGELRRKKEITRKAEDFFQSKHCNIVLFALIDFCSAICKPVSPLCSACMLHRYCQYYIKTILNKHLVEVPL